MSKFYLLLSLFFLAASSAKVEAQDNQGCDGLRYVSPLFQQVKKTTVQYGANINYSGQQQNLFMDVYEPVGDNIAQRPVLVVAHPGSFISGQRSGLEELCTNFAQLGYVTATIDYRLISDPISYLGFPPDTLKALDVVIKDWSDMKAAVRYFRQDAATENKFKIDPDLIFVGGASAGAIVSLHVAYMDESDDIPAYLEDIINNNGGWEGNSGDAENLQYSSKVSGVLNLSGSLYRSSWLQAGDVPLASYHGTADPIVPFGYGYLSGSFGPFTINLMKTYGSGTLQERADELGIPNVLSPVQGGGHEDVYFPAHDAELDAFFAQAVVLFHNVICPNTAVGTDEPERELTELLVHPNPASEVLTVSLQHIEQPYRITVYDQLGRLVHQRKEQTASQFQLQKADFGSGFFYLMVQSERNKQQAITQKIIFQ